MGRKPVSRRKDESSVKAQSVGFRNVDDIFTGKNHAFCKVTERKTTKYYAWGQNNFGQLGI